MNGAIGQCHSARNSTASSYGAFISAMQALRKGLSHRIHLNDHRHTHMMQDARSDAPHVVRTSLAGGYSSGPSGRSGSYARATPCAASMLMVAPPPLPLPVLAPGGKFAMANQRNGARARLTAYSSRGAGKPQ